MVLRPSRIPRNAVLSRVYGILVEMQKYRILSEIDVVLHQNGVENGVVKLKMETSNIEI